MKETKKIQLATLLVLGIAAILLLYNSIGLSNLKGVQPITGKASATLLAGGIIPAGAPKIYGEELGLQYDDVSPSNPQRANLAIARLGQIDRDLQLEGAEKERYIDILYRLKGGISCEYCCGARSIIFENGDPACGCAHSYAMRGLAKYLITEHGDEYTDEEILSEVARWKTLFFPSQMEQKARLLEEQGIEQSYSNLGSNAYRGIEQGIGGGQMVGGC